MSSAQNNPPAGKNGPQTATAISGGRKTTSAAAAARGHQPHCQEPARVNCPRCDSPHTKFCYYNNYSLAQPRHFCKTCRRYWTKGGALRNVPVGGGSRKNKKTAASATDHHTSGGANGLRFFQDLSPAMDFQLSHYGAHMPPPKTNPTAGFHNQLSSSLGDLSADNGGFIPARNSDSVCDVPFSPPLSGFNYFPFSSKIEGGISTKSPLGFQDVGPSLVSSIESLSYINQDLHWKLQQQRLGLMFVADYNKDSNNNNNNNNNDKDSSLVPSSSAAGVQNFAQRRRLPILYQNTEISSADESCAVIEAFSSKEDGINGDLSTEWFLGNDNENSCYTNNLNNDKSSSRSSSGFQAWNGLGYF